MKRKIPFLLALVTVIAGAYAQQTAYFMVNGRKISIRDFDNKIKRMMDDIGVPGASLAIIDSNRIVYSSAYGYVKKGGAPINSETIFEACSLSKSFLVYMTYKLVDEGKLNLDKPIYQYLEKRSLKKYPGYSLITPRMLLSHCSGIENWKEMNNPDSLEIVAAPGKSYVYSGEGYHYLAEVVQMLMKEPYEKAIKRVVLDPLHLTRTYTSYAKDDSYPLNYAIGHTVMGDTVPKRKNHTPIPAALVHTTAEDYANLIIHLFNGKNLSDARVKDVLTPAVRLIEIDSSAWYGAGFEIIYSPHDTLIAHGGANAGFRNAVFYSVTHQRGFVLMTNQEWGKKMAEQINKATVDMDITPRTRQYGFEDQYPDNATKLLNTYRTKGVTGMLQQINQLKQKNRLGAKTLVELSYALPGRDSMIGKQLLNDNAALFSGSVWPYLELGYYYYERSDYAMAHKYFAKVKEMYGEADLVNYELKICEEKKEAGIK